MKEFLTDSLHISIISQQSSILRQTKFIDCLWQTSRNKLRKRHQHQTLCVSLKLIATEKNFFPRKMSYTLVDTGRKLNVHETFRRCPGRLMYVQFTSCVYWDNNSNKKIKFHVSLTKHRSDLLEKTQNYIRNLSKWQLKSQI